MAPVSSHRSTGALWLSWPEKQHQDESPKIIRRALLQTAAEESLYQSQQGQALAKRIGHDVSGSPLIQADEIVSLSSQAQPRTRNHSAPNHEDHAHQRHRQSGEHVAERGFYQSDRWTSQLSHRNVQDNTGEH